VVLTGVFSSLAVNAAGEAGGWTQLGRQAVLAVAAIVYPFVMTWIILWLTDRVVGLQVSPEEEEAGLDLAEHGEASYEWPGVGATSNGVASGAATAAGPAAS
jgi:ammonium transporter, Amt family